jgi:hypothetical protein
MSEKEIVGRLIVGRLTVSEWRCIRNIARAVTDPAAVKAPIIAAKAERILKAAGCES